MILFLDFDGVLHPMAGRTKVEENFANLPLLEDWLRLHTHVQVVISSSWRDVMSLDDLRHIFSPDIRHRVIDKCPPVYSEPQPEYWRHAEITAWIEQTGYTGPWLALDDAMHEFPEDFEQLVKCDIAVGIDEEVLAELTSKVNKMRVST